MVFQAPSATNGYIAPATGQVIAFVRKPKHFKTLNSIVQYTPSKKPTGKYARLDRDNGGRFRLFRNDRRNGNRWAEKSGSS